MEQQAVGQASREGQLSRRFLTLLVGTASSGLGDGLVKTAFPLLMLAQTDNPLAVAGIAATLNAPRMLLSLHAGALVDRSSLPTLLGRIDGLRLLCMSAMTLVVIADINAVIIPAIYATAFVVGTGDVIVQAGVQRSIPLMVQDGSLERANSLRHAAEDITDTMIGPALGGVLYTIGAPIPFGVDALTFLLSAVIFLRVLPVVEQPTGPEGVPARSLTEAAMEGVAWLRAQTDLRIHVVVVASFAMLQAGMIGLLPLVPAARLFEGRALGLMLASGSAAAVLGSIVAPKLVRGRPVSSVMTIAGTVAGVGYLGLGLSRGFPLAVGFLALEGFVVTVALIASVTWRQRRVPNELIGRVFSAIAVAVGSAAVIGALAAGAVASLVGTQPTLVVIGVFQIAVPALLHPFASRPVDAPTAVSPAPGASPPGQDVRDARVGDDDA